MKLCEQLQEQWLGGRALDARLGDPGSNQVLRCETLGKWFPSTVLQLTRSLSCINE